MFKKKKDEISSILRSKKDEIKSNEVVAFLDKGIEFKGVLSFEGTIRIDGRVEGEIVSPEGTLILGDDAFINGRINVSTLISHGKLQGDAIVKNKINLLSGSTLNGNIKTPVLVVEEGAFFEGQSFMSKEDKVVQSELTESDKKEFVPYGNP